MDDRSAETPGRGPSQWVGATGRTPFPSVPGSPRRSLRCLPGALGARGSSPGVVPVAFRRIHLHSGPAARRHATVDPVMDFLVNVKQGHCERFASALALMLRSQGIPSRVVVGFRGADERGDGYYVIRQNQAHAWVEMQKPGPAEPPDLPAGAIQLRCVVEWITLEPTPSVEIPPPASYSLWELIEDSQRSGQEWWGGMIVNYGAAQQADLWATLQSPRVTAAFSATALGLPVFVFLGALTWVGLRWRRRCARAAALTAAPTAAGYARLLALLARYGQPAAADRPDAARVRGRGAALLPFIACSSRLSRIYRMRSSSGCIEYGSAGRR